MRDNALGCSAQVLVPLFKKYPIERVSRYLSASTIDLSTASLPSTICMSLGVVSRLSRAGRNCTGGGYGSNAVNLSMDNQFKCPDWSLHLCIYIPSAYCFEVGRAVARMWIIHKIALGA